MAGPNPAQAMSTSIAGRSIPGAGDSEGVDLPGLIRRGGETGRAHVRKPAS